MSKGYTLVEIAKWVGGAVRGEAGTRITGVSGVAEAGPSHITWLAHEKYIPQLKTSKAGAVVVSEQFGETPMPAILVADPMLAVAVILERFAPPIPRPKVGVHPSAQVARTAGLGKEVAVGPNVVVGDGTRIGDRVVLHANVFVGNDVKIGDDCELWPGVVIRERCILGNRVAIHPNTTIGSDGYGYQFVEGKHRKIPQIGSVEIADDVEIGANCAVDRAKFGITRIGEGTKIDNLVQVAHNVQIGPHCLIVAQCGIAGSTQLGTGVVLGGQVGVRDHVRINDGVRAAALSGISKDIPAGAKINGNPAVDNQQFLREKALIRQLPRMAEQIKALMKRVEQLEATADDS
ncbi:MAG: UDP-3-O-(3-hydroxymyristoyl)glucosamine N-acyltransferase [Planctomycetota bacterium]|nr:MAG: UDP-3-O-(3-hydroxymyristoyl)glucosamine N-acyltransferase [Planctomycetota bacterium]